MQTFSKNPEFIKKLFNSISNNYDKLNDIMTFGLHRRIKKDVIKRARRQEGKKAGTLFTSLNSASPAPTGSLASPELSGSLCHISPLIVLDLCTGTGDMANLLKEKYPNAQITGIDFSSEMLKIAKAKWGKSPDIEFLEADCSQLPFESESFDLCIISFGLRNVENIEKVLREIYRVLKRDGIFINLDLGKPNKFFNLFLKPYMYIWVSLLGKLFHGDETPYKYLAASNEDFPSPKELVEMYQKIGFSDVKNKNYLFGQIASQISRK